MSVGYILAAILLILCAVLLAGGIWISGLLRHGHRQPVSHSPENVGPPFEEIAFQSDDGLLLKGWWLPADVDPQQTAQSPAVVLLHPMFGNRHGFQSQYLGRLFPIRSAVDLLPMAHAFHHEGFSVLMFDFRSHGESQAGVCAGGLTEDQDVSGAIAYVFQRLAPYNPLLRPSQQKVPAVGVVGFGLGAAAAMAAIGRTKGGYQTMRVFSGDMEGGVGYMEIPPSPVKRLRFAVLVQPVALGILVRNALYLRFGLLGRLLLPVVDRCYQQRGGHSFAQTSLERFIAGIQMPLLYVQARGDSLGNPEQVGQWYEASTTSKEIWWVEDVNDRLETYTLVVQHPHRILAFARKHVG